jgi:putative membrane protein
MLPYMARRPPARRRRAGQGPRMSWRRCGPNRGVKMLKALLHFVVIVITFLLLARTLPGFYVPNWGTAVLAALVLGLANATVGLLLKIITFPLILLTFGIFYFVVNALVLLLTAFLVPQFSINGFLPAFVAALVLAAVNLLWKAVSSKAGD